MNYQLKGDGTTGQDFFPIGPFTEQETLGVHGVITTQAPVPEPGNILLLLAGGVSLAGLTLRRKRAWPAAARRARSR